MPRMMLYLTPKIQSEQSVSIFFLQIYKLAIKSNRL